MAQSSLLPARNYRLETFGKVSLTGGSAGSLSHQRRRLALLTPLAAAGKRGLSRDQLIGILWPEAMGDTGRHSLEQLLHAVRRALGESVFTGTNPLVLNAGVISSDVNDFNRALADSSLRVAVDVYAGPFLEGFYLDQAAEFERWAATERSRLETRYCEALSRLASEAESNRSFEEAIGWRRKLVETDPVSSRHALGLMRALVAAGDQTAALQHSRIYEALVRQELDSSPDPTITDYVASLRAGTVEVARPSQPIAPVHVPQPPPENVRQSLPAPMASVPTTPRPHAPPASNQRRAWAMGLALATTVVIAVIFAARRNNEPALDENRILVVPFRIAAADSSVAYLAEGAVDLIVPMLNGEAGPSAIDSRSAISTWNRITRGREGTIDDGRAVARELGASLILSGSAVESNGQLQITGSLISTAGGSSRALPSVTGRADSVDALLRRFVAQLLARQSNVAEGSIDAVTSQSLPAIKAYLSGRAAYRRADESVAIERFARALEIDSTFALAALDLAVSTGKLLRTEICRNESCRVYSIVPGMVSMQRDQDLFDRGVRLAWESRASLGRRDLPLLDALRGATYPRESSARETLTNIIRAVREAPDRPETQYLMGILLLYQGDALGLTGSRADAISAFRAAARLDSSYLAPLVGLVDAAAFGNDTAGVRTAAILYLSRDASGPTSDYVRWVLASATNDIAGLRAIRGRFRSLSNLTLDHIYLTAQMSGVGLDDADSAAVLLIEHAIDPLERSIALRRAQLLALNRGRPAEATRMLRRVDELRVSGYTFAQFAIAAALYGDGEHRVADSAARALGLALARDTIGELKPDGIRRISVAMSLHSLWYLANGDSTRARPATAWLKRHSGTQPRNRIFVLLPEMLMASRQRRLDAAQLRASVDSTLEAGCCELPDFVSLVLAQAYEDAGDNAAALRVIRRGRSYWPPRSLSTHLREEGRLATGLGMNREAIEAYTRYIALRSAPEASRRGERDAIRQEVVRLRAMRKN